MTARGRLHQRRPLHGRSACGEVGQEEHLRLQGHRLERHGTGVGGLRGGCHCSIVAKGSGPGRWGSTPPRPGGGPGPRHGRGDHRRRLLERQQSARLTPVLPALGQRPKVLATHWTIPPSDSGMSTMHGYNSFYENRENNKAEHCDWLCGRTRKRRSAIW